MNATRLIPSVLFAAGTPGVALLAYLNGLPADVTIAGLTLVGLAVIAIFDYSRPTASLKVRAPVIRPTLPGAAAPATGRTRRAA